MKMKKVLSFLLAMIMVISITPVIQAQTPDVTTGLVLYYDFNTDGEYPSSVADKSGNGNNATVLNTVKQGVDNRLQVKEGVAYFPGYSYEDNGDFHYGAALKLPKTVNSGIESFTYSAWIKSSPTTTQQVRLFDFGNMGSGSNNTKNSIFARYTLSSGEMRIQDRGISSGSSDASSLVEANVGTAFNNAWSLFTLVFEKNEETGVYDSRVYIDGEEVTSLATEGKFTRSLNDLGELTDASNGLFIGRTVWTAANSYAHENPDFCGTMDEIRLYNRVLSEDEILYLYDNTMPADVDFVTGYEVDSVVTIEGNKPKLPETATFNMAFGDAQVETVTWYEMDESLYAESGEVTHKGTTALGEVECKITVMQKNEASSDGLILYYNFDNDETQPSTITDISGNGNDATVLNTVESNFWSSVNNILTVENGTARFPGNSVTSSFWGDMYFLGAALKLPNHVNQGVESFTYSAWVMADSTYMYADGIPRFFDFGNIEYDATEGTGAKNSIFVRHNSATGELHIRNRKDNNGVYNTFSDLPFTDKWGLLTVVYEKVVGEEDEVSYKLTTYVNGEKVENLSSGAFSTLSLTDLGVLTDDTNGMFIGRTVWAAAEGSDYYTSDPDFCGWMDEIRLYNRVLTEDEITAIYENTKPATSIEATGYSAPNVTTPAGVYPILPETVDVTYSNGAVNAEAVAWDEISSDRYAVAGSFIAHGMTSSGYAVTANITVVKAETSTLAEGLVLYYSFDGDEAEPSEITDLSGNNNNAAVINNVQTLTVGSGRNEQTYDINNKITVSDGVATFPGNSQPITYRQGRDYVTEYPLGAALKLPNNVNEGIENFTYSAWVKADTAYTSFESGFVRFFDFGNISSDTYNSIYYRYTPSTGSSRFQDRKIASNGDDATSLIEATLSDNPFADNWAHLVITYEKQAGGYYTPQIYINGQLRDEYDYSITTLTRSLGDLGTLTDSSNGMFIGRSVWAAKDSYLNQNPDFKGEMDEIRLYNRVLSASEIKELYKRKPSNVVDLGDDLEIAITEDVELSGQYTDTNMDGRGTLMVSSNNGAQYTRYALVRTDDLTAVQKAAVNDATKVVLRYYVQSVANWDDDNYYCYGLTGDDSDWVVDSVTMNNYTDYLTGSISDVGVSDAGILLDTQVATGGQANFWMEWDVTDFVRMYADDEFSFLITAGSDCIYLDASEGTNAPHLLAYYEAVDVAVTGVDAEGNILYTDTTTAPAGVEFTYDVYNPLVTYNNWIYSLDESISSLTIDKVEEGCSVTVGYKRATDIATDNISAATYVGKAPSLPAVVEITADGYTLSFAVAWDDISSDEYAQTGTFTATGYIKNTTIPVTAEVTVFPEYNGAVGGDLMLYIYADGELHEEKRIGKPYGSTFTLDESYETYLGKFYSLDKIEGDVTGIGESIVMNQLNQSISLYFAVKEELEATVSAKIKGDDLYSTTYSLRVKAEILNTKKTDETVYVSVADYNENGELVSIVREEATVESRTGKVETIELKLPYVEADNKDMKIFVWADNMEALCEAVEVADVEVEKYVSDVALAMLPTYDSAVETIRSANDYWQSEYDYNEKTNGIDVAFWARAAYHTGNMEVYKLLADEDYLQYSIDWANYSNWSGNNYQGDPSTWTWGYNQTQGSNAVLFGDWQICFQSYIDMYNFGVEDANLDRVRYVMDYQISKSNDDFWWWADGLYMVMPVMTKLYKLTDDVAYLDALYKWFKFAKELMYDGPGGIPTSSDGYTSTAGAHKSGGSYYSDPNNYAYLFYRDGGYAYPLNPNPGHANEKNFWARGNGWVFAGLAKVLADMPETYEHYDEFHNTYIEMAPAIIACQETDDSGYGFWTQSMLQNYPTGNNGNNEGYETSGTAFMTYGLFWGINNGILDGGTYLDAALRGWGYLKNVALQSDGLVGYVQPIGSNATHATPYNQTQDFGVGAFLLASCEAARFAQGLE